jgi:serine/threonine protein kinase
LERTSSNRQAQGIVASGDCHPESNRFLLSQSSGIDNGSGSTSGPGLPEVQAPELFVDPRDVSHASDLYSLGCCLFFALSGRFPFETKSGEPDIVAALLHSPWKSRAAKQVPKCFRPVLNHLLAKNPHDRYTTAEELAQDLQRLDQAGSTLDRPVVWLDSQKQAPGNLHWVRRLFGKFRRDPKNMM